MNYGTYRFKVGGFECATVSDGTFVYEPPMFPAPAQFLFVNAPEDRLAQALVEHGLTPPEEWKEWRSDYTCLLVDAGGVRVLVDTGAGALAPSTGALVKTLASLGIGPGQIDLVILTHAHPDHLGGNVDEDGHVAFPRARWVISKTEWAFWMEGQAEAVLPEHGKERLLGSAQRHLSAIGKQVDLVVGEGAAAGHYSAASAWTYAGTQRRRYLLRGRGAALSGRPGVTSCPVGGAGVVRWQWTCCLTNSWVQGGSFSSGRLGRSP